MSSDQNVSAFELPVREQQHNVNDYFARKASAWRQLYDQGDVKAITYQHRRDWILAEAARLRLPTGSPVLEIGCGAGFVSVGLAKMGCAVEAIDSVPAMLNQTRMLARQEHVDAHVRTLTAESFRLPFKDESFSLVLAVGVIPWLLECGPTVSEVRRVLRTSGVFIGTADNRRRLNHLADPLEWARAGLRFIRSRAHRRLRGASPSVNMLTISEMDQQLAHSGLVKQHGVTFGFGPFTLLGRTLLPNSLGLSLQHRLNALAQRGAPVLRSTGSQYIFVAQK